MILLRRGLINIAETRFGVDPARGYAAAYYPGADIGLFLQNPEPVEGARCEESYTLVNDLTLSEDHLFSAIAKNTRYKIQRARNRDQLEYRSWGTVPPEAISEFAEFFSRFASKKGISPISPVYLKALVSSGAIDLSVMRLAEGRTLSWHAHFIGSGRARLLWSASIRLEEDAKGLKNVAGRANRCHHWNDLIRFRSAGMRVYDFGGWYSGSQDADLLRNNEFKEDFGGTVERTFNCELALTLRGRAYISLREAVRGARAFYRQHRSILPWRREAGRDQSAGQACHHSRAADQKPSRA